MSVEDVQGQCASWFEAEWPETYVNRRGVFVIPSIGPAYTLVDVTDTGMGVSRLGIRVPFLVDVPDTLEVYWRLNSESDRCVLGAIRAQEAEGSDKLNLSVEHCMLGESAEQHELLLSIVLTSQIADVFRGDLQSIVGGRAPAL